MTSPGRLNTVPTVVCLVVCAFLAATALGGCDSTSDGGHADSDSILPLSPCQLSAPGASERQAAQCGMLTVPVDPEDAEHGTIDLRVAVVPSVNEGGQDDPLFLIAGGPGQAATEAFPPILASFDKINEDRDLVMVDQRGTGSSSVLACPEEEGDLTELDPDALRRWAEECVTTIGMDTNFFTTSHAVRDLESVRQALGFQRVNLYGGSYGTRVALEYVRRHPDRLRSVVLDGVLPPDSALGTNIALDAQRALDMWMDGCAEDEACHAAFPGASDDVDALLARLEDDPVEVEIADPVTGEPTKLLVSRPVAASVLRFLSYSPAAAALIPLLVHRANEGDLAPLAAQHLMIQSQSGDTMALGMHFAVVCAEDVPFYDTEEVADRNRGTYLGGLVSDSLSAACESWPVEAVADEAKTAVASDVPVLLLSGELDPVTPPSNGSSVAAHLANGRHVVAPGLGHGTVIHSCIRDIVSEFVDGGDVNELDTTCVENIAPEPLFVNFSGPVPSGQSTPLVLP